MLKFKRTEYHVIPLLINNYCNLYIDEPCVLVLPNNKQKDFTLEITRYQTTVFCFRKWICSFIHYLIAVITNYLPHFYYSFLFA